MTSLHETFLALFIVLASAFSNALLIVLVEYVEEVGATWHQVLFTNTWGNLFFTCWYWILSFSYSYYYKPDDLKMTYNSLASYLLSVFPPIDRWHVKHWLVLILRGIFALFCAIFLCIGLIFVPSGDCVLIESVVASVTSFIFGFIFFKEKINVTIIFAFILFVIGITLVTQPTFIFKSVTNATSPIGLLWVFLGSVLDGLTLVVIKWSKTVELSYTTVMVVPQLIMSILLLILYIYGWQVLNWGSSLISLDNDVDKFLQACTGFIYFLWLISVIIGVQLGNLGRVAMISNSNIIFAYLLQVTVLNEYENYICYIGIVITLVGCIIVFYEQYEEQDDVDVDNGHVINARLSQSIIAYNSDSEVDDYIQ